MKKYLSYRQYFLSGEWHIHTNFTDGKNTIREYCTKAKSLGIPLLAFTEHVRKKLEYDFDQFLEEIDNARNEFDLVILSGFEAKLLPGGDLDLDTHLLNKVDYPILAIHSFPKDMNLLISSLKTALKKNYVCTWAHPYSYFLKNCVTLPHDALLELFELMKINQISLEINEKYGGLPSEWVDLARRCGVFMLRGSDVHSIEDLKHF